MNKLQQCVSAGQRVIAGANYGTLTTSLRPQTKRPGPRRKTGSRTNAQIRLGSSERMSIVAPTQTSVYQYFDKHDILIYVGITSRGIKRNHEHNATKGWWGFVNRQTVEHFDSRSTAVAREKALIQKHSPPFNTQHNRGSGDIRAAYLMFLASIAESDQVRAVVKAMQNRIELDAHLLGSSETVVLRTRLEDAPIVAAMRLPDGEMPRVFGLKGKGVSKLRELERHGPFALLHLGPRWRHPIKSAYANVRFDPKNHLHLRNIHVVLDHGDGSECSRRCPSHLQNGPRTRWIRSDGEGAA